MKHTLVAPVASIPIFLIVLSWHNEINEYRIGNAVEKNVSKKKWYRSIWTKHNITQTVVDACWFECFPSYCRLLFEVSSHLFSLSPFVFCFLSTHFPFSFVCVRNILNILQSRFESKAKKKVWNNRLWNYCEGQPSMMNVGANLDKSDWKNRPERKKPLKYTYLSWFTFYIRFFLLVVKLFLFLPFLFELELELRGGRCWAGKVRARQLQIVWFMRWNIFLFFFFCFEIKMGAHMLSHISLWYKLKQTEK